MRKKLSLISFACLPLFACGGDSGGSNKTVKVVDAKTFLDGPPQAACKAPASYTTNLGSNIYAADTPAGGVKYPDHSQEIQGLLAQTGSGQSGSDTVDLITILLDQQGSGMFKSGINAGTYTVDPSMDNSLEILLWPGLPGNTTTIPDAYLASEQYLAFSGSLTLTAEGGSGMTISGTLTSLDFVHVDLANMQFTAANDDGSGGSCESTIASTSFSKTLKYVAPTFQGQIGAPVMGAERHPLVLTHRHQN